MGSVVHRLSQPGKLLVDFKPAAILIARFYRRDGYLALKLHIYLQIMTLLLSTVVFILGWFAVGPARSLTNPHHGIGLAIYVLIWVQVLGGWWVHGREKGKVRTRMPLKLMVSELEHSLFLAKELLIIAASYING